uniref:Uncharacterized protein n=1 Tax=Fagus sylvatica TaxID=28930 RepID=A0A2N9ESL0_FAGSY
MLKTIEPPKRDRPQTTGKHMTHKSIIFKVERHALLEMVDMPYGIRSPVFPLEIMYLASKSQNGVVIHYINSPIVDDDDDDDEEEADEEEENEYEVDDEDGGGGGGFGVHDDIDFNYVL